MTDNEKVWHPNEVLTPTEDQTVTLFETKGNGFHLSAIVRKYTAARVQMVVQTREQIVKIEVDKLYDALGLLRSLQYDVAEFNTITTETPKSEAKYRSFRLTRQAAAFGVRVPPLGTKIEVPGLDSLINYIEDQKQDLIAAARSNVESGVVDFDSLQELFSPGKDLIDHGVGTGTMVPTMMRVRACYYSRGKSLFGVVSTFYVAMEFVVSAGDSKFLVAEAQFPQSQFNGTRSVVSSMDMFTVPSEALKKQLVARGEQYQNICGSSTTGTGVMVEYKAGTFIPTSKGSLKGGTSRVGSFGQASRSGGRMIVDTVAAFQRGVHCANNSGVASDVVVGSLKMYAQQRSQHPVKQGSDNYQTVQVSADGDGSNDLLIIDSPLPECLIGLTWPIAPGFSLQARTWGVVHVHGTSNVEFNEKAFEALVMSPARKKLIQALVTSHDTIKSADVIAGKGEGSIFLLHGPPGVGKTLTAEAIAEMLHKPLYVVSMGELGTTPEALEERLQDILDLCVPWKALVLIDEAEMLLERRTKSDIIRNAMVCVMLRLLEYYSGILFLTTNRVESLDPAFQSRVTCALRYDSLALESREEIWRNTMNRLGIDMTDIDTKELAKFDVNGRQIKNTLQLAFALSSHEGTEMTQEHLRATLEITTSFLDATK
jgi:hypothetical protein